MDDVIKTCTLCGESKPLDEFYDHKQKNGKVAKHPRCKVCFKRIQNARRAADPQKTRRQARESYGRHREAQIGRSREWRRKQTAEGAWQTDAYREKNRRQAEARRRTLRGRAEQVHYAALTRARNLGVQAYSVGIEEVIAVISQPCAICGSTDRIELDHIIPFARGGAHKTGNIQPLCRSCNRAKRDRTMTEFRLWLRRVEEVA